MANVLADDKKQQVLVLGRLGWPLRRIEESTGVRRETASAYLTEGGGDRRAAASDATTAGKTGQSGVHRLRGGRKTGQSGVHRLRPGHRAADLAAAT
jgi:hypothetical protein